VPCASPARRAAPRAPASVAPLRTSGPRAAVLAAISAVLYDQPPVTTRLARGPVAALICSLSRAA